MNNNIMSIDMSKAFDSIYREDLITILEEAVPDISNRRILRYLLSNTTLQPKLNGELGDKFQTILGTPQGDALSPVLFTIYLEGVLRKFRQAAQYETTDTQMDTCYADDVDFINQTREANEANLRILEEELPKSGLIINGGKTEFIDINTRSRPNVRKLGSRIDSDNDIMIRISSGNVAFKKLKDLWRRKKHVKVDTKIALYQTTIVSILTYNLGSNAAHSAVVKKMDTTHRKHLRQILNIYYPNKISNKDLYQRCNTKPMSQQIRTIRWKLFGHILRLPKTTPPQRLMDIYMQQSENKICKRGGQYLTIARLIHKELRPIGRTFNSISDLEELRQIAVNRSEWQGLREAIEAKWERQEKENEAKRKLVILLTPARTRREEEVIRVSPPRDQDNEDQEGPPPKKQRTEIIIKINKRNVEAIIKLVSEEEEEGEKEVVTEERLWKRTRTEEPRVDRV
jgi:hypothetical protein